MEIEGKSTEGFTIEDAVKVLKGKPGEDVTIGILHAGGDKVEQIKLTRELIHVATVLGDRYKDDGKWNFVLDDKSKIGYLRLTHFSRRSAEEMQEAMDELKEAGLKGLVLDLRFNPGGLLTEATEIADMFIESGRIVSTKGRNTPEKVVEARAEGTFSGFPMAILVNHYSASASEIVSACLQDHKRAVIIGERTWGKGSVQNVIDLEGGESALKLTTASYHRPSGKNIHRFPGAKDEDEWGVMPDSGYELKLNNEETQKYLEYRRERDVLSKEPPKSEYVDKQLAKALEYINGQLSGAKPDATEKKEEKKAEAPKNQKDTKSGAALPTTPVRRAA
jgi:carboxyl-terminal processing protease